MLNMDEGTMKYFDQSQKMVTHLIENNVDNGSSLRPRPTQLNYFVDTNYSSLGGLPYLGKGYSTSRYADKESELKFFTYENKPEDRTTELKIQRSFIIDPPIDDMSNRMVPRSTRSDYRNMLQQTK